MPGPERVVHYPYTATGKFMNFPWKFYWKNGRYTRYLTYAILVTFPIMVKVHSAVHSPGNVRQWEKIRKARDHTFFEPVEE